MIKTLSAIALAAAVIASPAAAATKRTHVAKRHVHHRHYVRSYDQDPDAGQGYYGGSYQGEPNAGEGYYPTDPYSVPARSRTGRVPVGTYGEPVPFRTVQPTDVGIGALAGNGYRGPGTASGGPAGGLNNGGGR